MILFGFLLYRVVRKFWSNQTVDWKCMCDKSVINEWLTENFEYPVVDFKMISCTVLSDFHIQIRQENMNVTCSSLKSPSALQACRIISWISWWLNDFRLINNIPDRIATRCWKIQNFVNTSSNINWTRRE